MVVEDEKGRNKQNKGVRGIVLIWVKRGMIRSNVDAGDQIQIR